MVLKVQTMPSMSNGCRELTSCEWLIAPLGIFGVSPKGVW